MARVNPNKLGRWSCPWILPRRRKEIHVIPKFELPKYLLRFKSGQLCCSEFRIPVKWFKRFCSLSPELSYTFYGVSVASPLEAATGCRRDMIIEPQNSVTNKNSPSPKQGWLCQHDPNSVAAGSWFRWLNDRHSAAAAVCRQENFGHPFWLPAVWPSAKLPVNGNATILELQSYQEFSNLRPAAELVDTRAQ